MSHVQNVNAIQNTNRCFVRIFYGIQIFFNDENWHLLFVRLVHTVQYNLGEYL